MRHAKYWTWCFAHTHTLPPCRVRVYVALLRAAGRTNRIELCTLLYKKMLLNPPTDLDASPFHLVMEAHIKLENWPEAFEVLRDMDRCQLPVDLQAYNTLLAALTKGGRVQQALQVGRFASLTHSKSIVGTLGSILGML